MFPGTPLCLGLFGWHKAFILGGTPHGAAAAQQDEQPARAKDARREGEVQALGG